MIVHDPLCKSNQKKRSFDKDCKTCFKQILCNKDYTHTLRG
ncbi:hypothetical protein [Nitrosopumilus spindle-shaped virus]|uniref:Uncharacterized protein n=1 Tax=Nitrosopumilus spindle-shaped virus TaxID=2508184 RepID=A0A514K344_9VIRU|nr:hypothetical protein [Nitrosopumilus spindle-shaped virus]